jgi:hypothetical protein
MYIKRLLKNNLLLSFLLGLTFPLITLGQTLDPNKKYDVACIGFYNLENLYDTIDSPNTRDSEFTPAGDKQWNSKRYYEKLNNLSRVISEMGKEITPDGIAVLGVCEIENRMVLEDLVKTEGIKNRNYQIVHYDSPDRRGVDVGLLYQPKYFKLTGSKSYTLHLPADTSFRTRDQLLVSGELLGEKMHYIVCHWPSRSGGEAKSAPLRMAAALLTMHIMDSLRKEDPNAKIIVMGDLNDDPKSVSVKKGMRSVGNIAKLKPEQLFNASEDAYNKGIGTLAWRDAWNLFDQMIMTPALVDPNFTFSELSFYKFKVFNKPFLANKEGSFAGYPFRTYVGNTYQGGFSDHFAVYTILVREHR